MPSAKDIVPLMHFNHSPSRRTFAFAVLLATLTLFTGEAEALGLGKLTVLSRLGAVFQAEVQIIEGASDTRLTGDCFRLSRLEEADSGIPVLSHGRISLERQNGQSRLIIVSDQTINEPALQINLRASCGSEVVRSYTVLIDPASPQQLASQTVISPPPANRSTTAEKSSPSPASGEIYPKTWPVAQGESAQSVARALFPRQPSARRRFLTALQAENPQFDLGVHGEAQLNTGTELNVPDTRRRSAKPALDADENRAPNQATPGNVRPVPARREKTAAQKSAGRMADRLVISGDADAGSSGSELPLRLSTDLSTRFSSKVSENSRVLLRLEYKLLSALYAQAEQQLAMAEQVRNLETSFAELRIATENTSRQTEAAMASGASMKPVVPLAPEIAPVTASSTRVQAVAVPEPPKPKQEGSASWWLEILIVMGLIGALTWALLRRAEKREAASLPIVADKPLYIPPPVNPSDKHDPWAAEGGYEEPQQTKTSASANDIVLDNATVPALGAIKYEKQDIPVKHMEVDEAGDYKTVIELADIMVCFGRIKGATQALEEFLVRDPKAALLPWLKLLEIYRMNEMREEFEAYSIELRTHFNVAPSSWEIAGECLKEPIPPVNGNDLLIADLLQKLPTIGTLPHIKENILNSWGSPDGLTYLRHLLRDTRDGKRSGFPLAMACELQFLVDLLETRSQSNA